MKRIWLWLAAAIMLAASIISQPASYVHAEEKAAAAVTDPYYDKQGYLEQIHAPEAWEWMRGKTLHPVTIAVVDTGVDLGHPDLKGRIIDGKNILNPSKPPIDDYGHGTNVAGVIAAITGNGEGIAGIAPNARIMPVKAIDNDGHGEEKDLGEGIRYAVDNGADIVVLSLGLNLYSTYLSEIISYAEHKGILLIAATGNEGKPVKYPAAYDTVMAVGGASVTSKYKSSSNFGPEVDIVAPWYVYTTAIGGGYVYKEGTSMAAPQAAAVAALMLGLNPELKPAEIRERLKQTAQPIGGTGWNQYTGYGLLRADRALANPPEEDMYEPNNSFAAAKPISVATSSMGSFHGQEDVDWFYLDPPYKGQIELHIHRRDGSPIPAEVSLYDQSGGLPKMTYELSSGNAVQIPVTKNRVYISIRPDAGKANIGANTLSYTMKTDFHIYRDAFEDNDRAFKAFSLAPRTQELTGTFHQLSDQDWYALQFDEPGILRMKVTTDTPRIDPELYIASEGEAVRLTIDDGGEGGTEYSPAIEVGPGKYYVRIRNVKSLFPFPVAGEYKLNISFDKKYEDGNEPNDKYYQATTTANGSVYKGLFDAVTDEDWFKLQVGGRSLVTIEMAELPKDRYMYYVLYNSNLKQVSNKTSPFGSTSMAIKHELAAGTYYIKLKTDAAYQDRQYNLRVRQEPLIAGFRDIEHHWARKSIERLAQGNIVNGYGDYRFNPDQSITRAEATVLLLRMFSLKDTGRAAAFHDVNNDQWYADAISRASAAEIIQGYPDGTFRPDQPVTRAEMAAMTAKAAGIEALSGTIRFADVGVKHWAAGYLNAFGKKQLLQGFKDGTYRPNIPATRAQFVVLLDRVTR